MSAIKVNVWTTTDRGAHNYGHEFTTIIQGTGIAFKRDQHDAAAFLGCKIVDLRFRVVEMNASDLANLGDAGEL